MSHVVPVPVWELPAAAATLDVVSGPLKVDKGLEQNRSYSTNLIKLVEGCSTHAASEVPPRLLKAHYLIIYEQKLSITSKQGPKDFYCTCFKLSHLGVDQMNKT